jgi:hypothetical protein
MQIFSIERSYPAPHGCRLLRPKDRSCWILVSPCGRYRHQYVTRKIAEAEAARKYFHTSDYAKSLAKGKVAD